MGGFSVSLQRGSLPLLLAALAVAFAAAWWAYRETLPPLPARKRRLLFALRFAAFAVLILLLMDPLVVSESVELVRPNIVLLTDRSASMGIVDRGSFGGETGLSRGAIAERILREEPYAALEKLRRRYELVPYDFAAALGASPETGGVDATDLARSLEEGARASWERGVDAFVVLTDGAVNAGRDPVRAASELGVPVFPIPIGDPTPPRDLAIEQVLANPLVYVNSRVNVEATILGKGFAGEEARVLLREGDAVLAEERVRFEGKREARTVSLGFTASEPGVRRFAVEVPEREGELAAENNRVLFTVEVVKEKLEILVFAERPSWDFAFLRRTLERDANVHARFFVQGRDGKPESAGTGEGGAPFPYAEQDLDRTDLVMLLGLPSVTGREWGEVLRRYVWTRGGALVFLAAEPLAGVPAALAEILPVVPEGRSVSYDPAPFEPRLTEQGKRHPMLRLHMDTARNGEVWDELPPLVGWNRIGPARPGSVLLAVRPGRDGVEEEAPVLAFRGAGRGRVLFLNGGGFWRWEFRVREGAEPEGSYERFWSNAVRWLAAREGFRNVTVKPEKMTADRGEPVSFRGLVLDESLNPVADARIDVTMTGPGGGERRFQVEPDPAEGGAYRHTLGPLPPGDYAYAASAVRGEAPLGEDRGEFTVSDFSAEFLDTERNDALLGSIARSTGGRVLAAEDLPSWQGDLALTARERRVREEREVWNHVVFFLILLFLFSTEWLLRKRAGLS